MTGYLIGDDSTMEKVRGKKMAGLGKHHSTTAGTRVVGHSLVQALYVVQGQVSARTPTVSSKGRLRGRRRTLPQPDCADG